MDRFAAAVIRRKKLVICLYIIITAICVAMIFSVRVNYNMIDYLPPNAQSTQAIEIMRSEFSQAMPNANVLIRDVSLVEALEYKRILGDIPGVKDVMWLDDVADLKTPLAMQDAGMVEAYYKDECALFMLVIEDGWARLACSDIRDLIGPDNELSGDAVDVDFMQETSVTEVVNAALILIPLAVFIFMVATDSWLEPILILCTIGVAVLINMGTNVFFGSISFLTNSVSPLLQLAVSMDYAIFLMHSFADYREKYDKVEDAMKEAVKSSITTISASALTTLFGFLALVFMQFRIGADLGLILAKGIAISYTTVVIFQPALMLVMLKAIDKAHHRPLIPDTRNIYNGFRKIATPAVIIVMIIIVPSFLGQQRTKFEYGAGSIGPEEIPDQEKSATEELFGSSNVAVVLVPKGDIVKERDLSYDLERLDYVSSVMSYAKTVGTAIPTAFLSSDIIDQFYSENYARIIMYTDTPGEGDVAFALIEEINEASIQYYNEHHIAGQNASMYDMKTIVEVDNFRVNMIAIVSIFLVIMASFKSLMLPVILVITIEAGIWVNLSIPYFTNTSINFVGFLVLSTVQLGATVDYAILLTDHYRKNRTLLLKKEALHKSLGDAFKSILVSGFTLSIAGFTLYFTSTNSSVSDIGLLLGRGTLLSMFMVLCFLPPMLDIFDRWIGKTTSKSNFMYSTH
ncbi:MAG: MMPL family transporter [Oscillospiraceae bacterium]|nr:MMPL family transporter [Oscillospiraceae bacterium]